MHVFQPNFPFCTQIKGMNIILNLKIILLPYNDQYENPEFFSSIYFKFRIKKDVQISVTKENTTTRTQEKKEHEFESHQR